MHHFWLILKELSSTETTEKASFSFIWFRYMCVYQKSALWGCKTNVKPPVRIKDAIKKTKGQMRICVTYVRPQSLRGNIKSDGARKNIPAAYLTDVEQTNSCNTQTQRPHWSFLLKYVRVLTQAYVTHWNIHKARAWWPLDLHTLSACREMIYSTAFMVCMCVKCHLWLSLWSYTERYKCSTATFPQIIGSISRTCVLDLGM